jgi:acyl phosphate:glycerol-3-phosphate acyltransferase
MAGIICIIIAYLLGSVSTSILLSKFLKFQDPREVGSGNAGATNVWRTAGKQQAALVLLGDAFKGILAVWIARLFDLPPAFVGFVAVAAVIGHIYPIYFKFKGGKGVATMMGAVLALSIIVGIVAIIVWAAVVAITRYVSLGSLCAAAAAVLASLLFGKFYYAFPIFIMAVLIAYTHLENINRLRSGTENKITF